MWVVIRTGQYGKKYYHNNFPHTDQNRYLSQYIICLQFEVYPDNDLSLHYLNFRIT